MLIKKNKKIFVILLFVVNYMIFFAYKSMEKYNHSIKHRFEYLFDTDIESISIKK